MYVKIVLINIIKYYDVSELKSWRTLLELRKFQINSIKKMVTTTPSFSEIVNMLSADAILVTNTSNHIKIILFNNM